MNFVADLSRETLPAGFWPPVPPSAPSLWGPGAHGCCGTWLWYTGLVPKQVQLSGCGGHTALWHVLQDLAEQNSLYRKEGTGRSVKRMGHISQAARPERNTLQTGRYPPGNAWCQGRLKVMSLQIPLPEKTRLLFSIRRSIIRQGKNRAQGSALQSWAVFGWDALLAVSWWLWNTSLGPVSRRVEWKHGWLSPSFCMFCFSERYWMLSDVLRGLAGWHQRAAEEIPGFRHKASPAVNQRKI